MREVTMRKVELMKRVKKNMREHRDLFLRAQKGYRKAVIEELDEMLKDAKNGKSIRVYVELTAPVDHTEDYYRVIDMLEMSVDAKVTLNSQEFERYVRDKWEWSDHATMTNTSYTVS